MATSIATFQARLIFKHDRWFTFIDDLPNNHKRIKRIYVMTTEFFLISLRSEAVGLFTKSYNNFCTFLKIQVENLFYFN